MKFIGIFAALHMVLLLSLNPVWAYWVDESYSCISQGPKTDINVFYNCVRKFCCDETNPACADLRGTIEPGGCGCK
ncbi:MAG: hypothetical protein BGO67_04890 [Alphaproteobacteria bacterium 41-28]|nr:MAG: hypothetical protein BGO67_04890 [Alphaproteobacteria bacterium 41-28]